MGVWIVNENENGECERRLSVEGMINLLYGNEIPSRVIKLLIQIPNT